MFDTFDSRALGLADCYGHRFARPGSYHYQIVQATARYTEAARPLTIKVVERPDQELKRQHTVKALPDESHRFAVQSAELEIGVGDLVLWNCADARSMPFAILGDKGFSGSPRLVADSLYSHAFGSAGDYEWIDAYGSGIGGVVHVKDPGIKDDSGLKRWHEQLAKGVLVTISDGRAEPRDVEIVTGQTVFFLIAAGPGISITDKRLLYGNTAGSGKEETRPSAQKTPERQERGKA